MGNLNGPIGYYSTDLAEWEEEVSLLVAVEALVEVPVSGRRAQNTDHHLGHPFCPCLGHYCLDHHFVAVVSSAPPALV